jgi:hypothetical protein
MFVVETLEIYLQQVFLVFFLEVLEFELRTLYCSYFCGYLECFIYARAGLAYTDSPIYTSCLMGMTGTFYLAQLFIG